jgi:hypothetical protein
MSSGASSVGMELSGLRNQEHLKNSLTSPFSRKQFEKNKLLLFFFSMNLKESQFYIKNPRITFGRKTGAPGDGLG